MDNNEQKSRNLIAEQAASRLVASDDGPLDKRDSLELVTWLKASPVHIEEILGVAAVARDMQELRGDPAYTVEAMVQSVYEEEETTVRPLSSHPAAVAESFRRRWLPAALAAGVLASVSAGFLWMWLGTSRDPGSSLAGTTALHFETRHGEQRTWRLADDTVLHLDTDSAVTVRYGKTERFVMLTAGQAFFEVAHEPDRAFRVFAGAAEVIAIGTKFDVRLEDDATLVTMVEGRVAVGPSSMERRRDANPSAAHAAEFVELRANQQTSVVPGEWPPNVIDVDSQSDTAWLRRQIVFDHEPLKIVTAEFNRYAQKPISITSPALQNLEISGTFATDDIDAFIAFLRRLKGVRVEVTATQIRVSGD
jgi:transmembrane sensor